MEKSNEIKKNPEPLQVWCCGHCEAVHFKAGNVLLNFTKEEFADLTYSVNDVFQQEFGSLEFYHLISSLEPSDDVPFNRTIG